MFGKPYPLHLFSCTAAGRSYSGPRRSLVTRKTRTYDPVLLIIATDLSALSVMQFLRK